MTTTTTDLPTFDPVTDTAAWRGVLRKVGLVYLFSRLCVSIGAAIVAAELSADANIVTSDFPNSPFADPHYASKPIPGSAIRPMLDVLTSWDGIWYLRIVRFGYPHTVRPNITYGMSDARGLLPGVSDARSAGRSHPARWRHHRRALHQLRARCRGHPDRRPPHRELFGCASANARWC